MNYEAHIQFIGIEFVRVSMVCSIGSRGMAAIARLLAAGNVSQTIAEDLAHWDLATKYVQRELREADEANLLDEEDMHVFGLKPMADPLHLVCCNACKKPVKVSQYAAHAELCKSLSYVEDIISELNGGTGYKKPPRKKRRKSLTTSATTSVGYQQRLENRIGTPASEPNSNEQIHPNSSFVDAKRNSPCVDGTLMMDKSACFNPGNTEHSTGSVPPPTKHKKMIAAKGPTASDHSETANGVIKSTCTSTQESLKYVPVSPLATKIFFSQRNQRLRSAIRHLYYDASTKEPLATAVKPQELHSTAIPSCSSFSNNVKNEQLDDPQENVCQNLC